MGQTLLIDGARYTTYALEVCVCALLVSRGRWRRHRMVGLYVAGLLLLDGVGRSFVLNLYGLTSLQYNHFYWLTDFVLAVGAFLLVCALFRRACAQEEKLWRIVRLLLVLVFVLVVGISAVTLFRNYSQLATSRFAFEFSQNLYFSCLVLNTLLYILIQQFAIEDDGLALLVCGFGVQFAGQAACYALSNLTSPGGYGDRINSIVGPACSLGMLLIWAYAIAKASQEVPARLRPEAARDLVEATADS